MKQRYFTANHIDKAVLQSSSSGGIFTAVSDAWFSVYKENAVVYGCILDENLKAKHIRATTVEKRNLMRGSKYIASDISGAYASIAKDLEDGCYVLFSGTPCQVAAVKSFLSVCGVKYKDNLLTVELVCHGVGSTAFFEDYIKHLEKKYSSKAVSCRFRAKSRQGKSEDMEVVFANGKKYNAASTRYDWFYSAYDGYILRPSCFSCRFAKSEREADICISDNWKDFTSGSASRHLSAVITTTEQGCEWFEKGSKNLDFKETDIDGVYQLNLHQATPKPQRYDEFAALYGSENGYLKAQKFLGNNTLFGRLRSFAVVLLNKLHLIEAAKSVKRALKRVSGKG